MCCAPCRPPPVAPRTHRRPTFAICPVYVKSRRSVFIFQLLYHSVPKYRDNMHCCQIVFNHFRTRNVSRTCMWTYVLSPSCLTQNYWYTVVKVVVKLQAPHCCSEIASNRFEPAAKKNTSKMFSPAAQKAPHHCFRLATKSIAHCAVIITCCAYA